VQVAYKYVVAAAFYSLSWHETMHFSKALWD